jgi:hypothetical protein
MKHCKRGREEKRGCNNAIKNRKTTTHHKKTKKTVSKHKTK